MEPGAEKTERESSWTPELKIQAFKEIITAVLGLAVVLCTLVLAGYTLTYVGDPNLSDAKDVLLLVLGLAGVVVGYYFGRVPADARASQAQEQANEATAQAEQVNAQAKTADPPPVVSGAEANMQGEKQAVTDLKPEKKNRKRTASKRDVKKKSKKKIFSQKKSDSLELKSDGVKKKSAKGAKSSEKSMKTPEPVEDLLGVEQVQQKKSKK